MAEPVVHISTKDSKLDAVVKDAKVVKIRVYNRGSHALGFDGLYAWLYAKIYLKYGERVSFWESQIQDDMKYLNENYPGIHPSSISLPDFVHIFGIKKNFGADPAAIIQMKAALAELKSPVEEDSKFKDIFTNYLDPADFTRGWLAEVTKENSTLPVGKPFHPKCRSKIMDSAEDGVHKYRVVIPNMVVDAFPGPNSVGSARTLLLGGLVSEYTMGTNGWAIIGFDCGFEANSANEVRLAEAHTGEWIDIWVYPNNETGQTDVVKPPPGILPPVCTVNADGTCTPANGIRPDHYTATTPRELNPVRCTFTGMVPPSLAAINATRTAAGQPIVQPGDFICSDDIPQQWIYVGSVVGSGGTPPRSLPGPHLGNLPQPKYHYMLLIDCNRPANSAGADMRQIGVTLTNRITLKDGYFLLTLDDSRSITAATKPEHIKRILETVEKWMAYDEVTNKYLGIRKIRWKDVASAGEWVKIDGSQRSVDLVKYRAARNNPDRNEFTPRVTFNSFAAKLAGSGLTVKDNIWLRLNSTKKSVTRNFLKEILEGSASVNSILKLDSLHTPLNETMDDIIDFDLGKHMSSVPRISVGGMLKYPLEVAIISDGASDPHNVTNNAILSGTYSQSEWICKLMSSYILASNPEGKSLDALLSEPPDAGLLNPADSYPIESKAKRISELTTSSIIRIISNQPKTHWIRKIYESPRMKEYVYVVPAGGEAALPETYINHSVIPHIFCDRGDVKGILCI